MNEKQQQLIEDVLVGDEKSFHQKVVQDPGHGTGPCHSARPPREEGEGVNDMINLSILTAAEATERLRAMGMRITPETLRDGIEQKQFPFGNVVRGSKSDSPRCYVYEKKLMEWAQEVGYVVQD